MIRLLILLLSLNFFSCIEKGIKESNFVGYLVANDSIKIPFDFVFKDSLITISNSKENIEFIRSADQHDSIKFVSPYFEDYLLFHDHFDSLSGYLHNKSLERKVKFFALRGENKVVNHENFLLIEGKWKIIFNYDKSESRDSEMIISQNKNKIQGTFRTETGDYGFMQGFVDENKFNLSKKDQKRIRNINDFYRKKITSKTFTEKNLNLILYHSGKETVTDILNYRMLKTNKLDNNIQSLINKFKLKTIPTMPFKADFLMSKYDIPEGKMLGEKLKIIKNKWIENNFQISEKQIENIINN